MIKLFIYPLIRMRAVTVAYLFWNAPNWPWQQRFALSQSPDPEKYTVADIVIFSKTKGYRHKSIDLGINAITNETQKRGWSTYATEDAAFLSKKNLASVKVVVFLNNTGNLLTDDQKKYLKTTSSLEVDMQEFIPPLIANIIGSGIRH